MTAEAGSEAAELTLAMLNERATRMFTGCDGVESTLSLHPLVMRLIMRARVLKITRPAAL